MNNMVNSIASGLNAVAAYQPMKRVFGEGYMGHAATGMLRLPTFFAGLAAVQMVGELAFRGISKSWSGLFGKPANDGLIMWVATKIDRVGIRPYSDEKKYPALDLAKKAFMMTAFSILAIETVTLLGGTRPAIYNIGLTFMGPFRISSDTYFTAVSAQLKALGLI